MNRKACALLALLISAVWVEAGLGQVAGIDYRKINLGNGKWSYSYTLRNTALGTPVQEFTIWFDYRFCRNLQIASTSLPPNAWNELAIQPDTLLKDNGFYDARALGVGVLEGGSQSGFAVSFDWIGTGQPGAQRFDIVDPNTFATLYTDVTLPEPTTGLMLVLGVLLRPKHRRRRGAVTSQFYVTKPAS